MTSKRRASPPNPKIANRIRSAMEHYGISQKGLADKVGLSPSAINQMLTGATMPRDANVQRIADALGEDFEFLMAHTDKGTKGYGKIFGELMAELTADEVKYMRQIPPAELHLMIAQHSLKSVVSQRKTTRESAPGKKK